MCLGEYIHPSNLPYPVSDQLTYHCGIHNELAAALAFSVKKCLPLAVDKDFPGERILQKFKVNTGSYMYITEETAYGGTWLCGVCVGCSAG